MIKAMKYRKDMGWKRNIGLIALGAYIGLISANVAEHIICYRQARIGETNPNITEGERAACGKYANEQLERIISLRTLMPFNFIRNNREPVFDGPMGIIRGGDSRDERDKPSTLEN